MTKIVLLFCILFFAEAAPGRDVVRISNGEWPPYLSEKALHFGAASRIVEQAFDAVDIEVDYFFRPWKRSYRYALQGNGEGEVCHGSVVWVHTVERAELFNYSDVVIEETQVLFHLREKPLVWQKVEDLQGMIIGGTAHTIYPLFEGAETKGILTIQRAGNYGTLFQRLLAGRIDAVPQVLHVGQHFIENTLSEKERKRVTFSSTVAEKRQYHVIFSRKSDADRNFLKLFNKGLKIIRENGVYNAIMDDLNMGRYYVQREE